VFNCNGLIFNNYYNFRKLARNLIIKKYHSGIYPAKQSPPFPTSEFDIGG